jgi:hypothetical protein
MIIEFVLLHVGHTYPIVDFKKKKKNCWGYIKVVYVSYLFNNKFKNEMDNWTRDVQRMKPNVSHEVMERRCDIKFCSNDNFKSTSFLK